MQSIDAKTICRSLFFIISSQAPMIATVTKTNCEATRRVFASFRIPRTHDHRCWRRVDGEEFLQQQRFQRSFSIGIITRGAIGNRHRLWFLRNDPMSAMDIAPPDNAAGSGVDSQAQNVPPPARVPSDDPVTSSHIDGSHSIDAVTLGNTCGLATVDTTRPAIDLNPIAVDCYTLCCCRRYNRGADLAETKRGDDKRQQYNLFHGCLIT